MITDKPPFSDGREDEPAKLDTTVVFNDGRGRPPA